MRSEAGTIQQVYQKRSAFTLVEMLVSVALVLLMMTMFTAIFQMATNSVSKQRVIAETDQRSRSLTTIMRADFAKRSFRSCFPFLPQENSSGTVVPFSNREGYVYISCNDPSSGLDDLIQFTVDARKTQSNPDQSLYYGAGALLWDKIAENAGANTNTALQFSPNQPEADDGDMQPNGASGSDAAEISFFLRGGNLIRRVMLLREPLPVSGGDLEIQPKSELGNNYFITNVSGGRVFLPANPAIVQTDFWRYFDFSAIPTFPSASSVPNGVNFIGIEELSNDGTTVASLGNPSRRFGFNIGTGMSREHESASASGQFIGRFLHSETSADFTGEDFNWPMGNSSIGNPMDVTNSVTLNSLTGIVAEFDGPFGRGGMRRVEDVLMSNVREFRVELWDSRLGRWVIPGHQMTKLYIDPMGNQFTIAGDYHILRNQQYDRVSGKHTYGPLQVPAGFTGIPHVFDTWHPLVTRDFDGDSVLVDDIAENQAPYVPLKYYPPIQTSSPPGPSSVLMPDPYGEYDPVAQRVNSNRGYWNPGIEYFKGDVVFARKIITVPGWNQNYGGGANTDFEWLADDAAIPNQSVHVAYRCLGKTDGMTSGFSGATPPGWQSPGLSFVDNELLWQGFDNTSPLKSVRITIRFIEPHSETPKQLSLIMPMTD